MDKRYQIFPIPVSGEDGMERCRIYASARSPNVCQIYILTHGWSDIAVSALSNFVLSIESKGWAPKPVHLSEVQCHPDQQPPQEGIGRTVYRITPADYEREIKQLVDAMRYKLKKNAHKGRWEDLDVANAIRRLREETDELEEAASRDSTIEIILEAADVANFALIVANLAMKKAAENG